MQIVVDNLLVQYDKVGKGPVLVLLHGWGDSSATFRALTEQLKGSYTVVSFDLPGFGQTQVPPVAWNLGDYARFVRAALAKLQVKPYAFIAHSNGASVAIRGLASGDLAADRLVLLGAAGIRDRQKLRRLVLKIIAKVGKAATFWLPARHKKSLQKALYGAAGSDMLVAPHMQETFKTTVREDVQAAARQLHLPTLLIYGENDRATPPLYGEIYQRLIPGSRLEILPAADHFAHQIFTAKVADLIREFLK